MNISLNCEEVRRSLQSISSAMGSDANRVTFVFGKKGLIMSAASPKLTLHIKVPECQGKGQFTVDIFQMQKLLANRKEMELNVTKNSMEFKSGRYSGSIVLLPFEEQKFDQNPSDTVLKIPGDSGLAESLNIARGPLALSDFSEQGKDLVFAVRLKDNRMKCIVNDPYHIGSYNVAAATDVDAMFNIQDDILRKILSLTRSETGYDLIIEKNRVLVESDNLRAAIAMVQMDMAQVDLVIKWVQDTVGMMETYTTISSAKIKDTVVNMMAIFEGSKTISLNFSKTLSLSYKTSFGSIDENFETKVKGKSQKIKVSPDLLVDITSNLPLEKNMKIGIANNKKIGNAFLIMQSEELGFTYVLCRSE